MPSPDSFQPEPDRPSRTELRKVLRKRRRALTSQQQRQAAEQLARQLSGHPGLYRARHIAIYLPNDGEIDPGYYMEQARSRGVQFYLPVLHPIHKGRLVFRPYSRNTPLHPNRFGIPEPALIERQTRPAWALDAVLMPLVGFDRHGGRLGMGGGFYDRTFAFVRRLPALAPQLIGLAHEIQRMNRLPVAPWDIPLDSIVTDRARFKATP
ncbi:MAG: 5-formyltetrahydrofolate cyclo-ligase [Oleiphilaceae bacterium]|nr:5-formyltetrahydrofolate cyclo-ligase [Oleiphilaceae bacterium]